MRALTIILVILSVLAVSPRALAKNDFSPSYGGPTASDQVNQIYIPKFKLQFGVDGSANDVSSGNAFPVTAVVTSVPLITNYALEAGGHLASIDGKLTNPMPVAQSGTWTVMQGGAPWSVSQSGVWTTARSWILSNTTDSVSSVQSGNWSTRMQDGSGNLITSQASGSQRALDVGINVAGVQVDPRARTWNLLNSTDSVNSVQSGAWNIGNITGTVSLPTGASTSALQSTGNASLASIDSKLANPMPVAQSGVWTTGRTWTLSNSTDSVSAVQSGIWVVRDQDGSGNGLTSQVSGSQRALDVGIDVAGIQVDPRTRTWNLSSSSDSVSANISQSVQDTMPASQNVTVQDTASSTTTQANNQSITTGTPTVGSAATFLIASMTTVQVTVSGSWTGTLISEVSLDGSTWLTGGLHQRGTSYNASSFTQNFSGLINTAGVQKYRVRSTAAMTGTATVLITESINASSVYIANSLKLSDATTPSNQLTIKAASTAAQTTDTAAVVSVSPNSPVKIAANTNGSVANITASTTPTTVSPPANAVGFILESDSTNTVNCRWAVGSTASATIGKLEEPGRDSGYLPMAANISVYCAAPAQTVSVQWVLSQ